MPTYTLIASNILSTGATTVTFSSIPATYADLVVKISARTNYTADVRINWTARFNGSTSTIYSKTALFNYNASVLSERNSSMTEFADMYDVNASTSTANTFANGELYIPSYTLSQNKPASAFFVSESATSSNTVAIISPQAMLWKDTAAITSISFSMATYSTSFSTGSSFFLYGIKNS